MSDELDPRLLRAFAESAERPADEDFTSAVRSGVSSARRTRRLAAAALLVAVLGLAAWAAPHALALSNWLAAGTARMLAVAGGEMGAAGAIALAASGAALAVLCAWRVLRRG